MSHKSVFRSEYMKKILSLTVAGVLSLAFTFTAHAAGRADAVPTGPTITVTHMSGVTQMPINPTRVVVFDLGILDTMEALGLERYIIGLPMNVMPRSLARFGQSPFVNLGTLHQPNFELIVAQNPDLIIISGRARPAFAELSRIAPTIDLALDNNNIMESFRRNNTYLGRIFSREAEMDVMLSNIDSQIAEVSRYAQALGSGTLIMMHNQGALRAFGPGSRFGLIHDVLGLVPADPNIPPVGHGHVISNEFIVAHNPDIMLVLDRNYITDRTPTPRHDIENELVRLTRAYNNGNIFYLDTELWYLVVGGVQGKSAKIAEISNAVRNVQ